MQEQDARILRGAAIPTGVAGLVAMLIFLLVSGWSGLLGALFGTLTVGTFFSASLIVTSRASRHGPNAMMAAAMVTYLVKIILLGILLVVLSDTSAFDFHAFAISILVGIVVWLSFQVRMFLRTKLLYVEPGAPSWLR